jgi:monothiol glutaredoxin
VQENDLVLFMKGTPEAPRCGFSARAVQALQQTGRPFHAVNVFEGGDPLTTIRSLAEWADFPTLPQVWVKGELIGGSDIAMEMVESGELQKMLS